MPATKVWTDADLSEWQRFRLWVEMDATQLGMDLGTYYGLCALVGLVQGFAIGHCIRSVL